MKALKIPTLLARYWSIILFPILISLIVLTLVLTRQVARQPTHAVSAQFIQRSGSQLLLDGSVFRFSGANIYWLGLDENVGGIDYPTAFRVDDVLATAREMGATVVRSHTLGISVGCSLCIEPSPGIFNEIAFRHVDYAIAEAKKFGLHLIIPLTDNFHYYHGGKHTFTDWRGIRDENQFYTNPTVISDFETYINHILNRVNSYTGVAYKNDPTILGWETGNGLLAPRSWVQTISAYIKSIDSNHLVIDGNTGQSYTSSTFEQDLNISSVDMYVGQYYPMSISALNTQAGLAQRANKVFIAEEYAWNNREGGDALPSFLNNIESNYAISGDLFWSLFGHKDTSGYEQHNDGYTLHYPGDTGDMRMRAQLLRAHAYQMREMAVPPPGLFGAPVITGTTRGGLEWRGVAGAYKYSVQRSTGGPDGPWKTICYQCATDNSTPWSDPKRPAGKVWYRIMAYSLSETAMSYSPTYEVDSPMPADDPGSSLSHSLKSARAQ
ncbi:MAG TPA: hypothetical protein VFA09_12760 [Ktedonobacteraceae bacterium]|nr:hypothetical protein [Ktedonobacteraceae bacterium]